MAKNIVRKVFFASDTWTAPAGTKSVDVITIPTNTHLVGGMSADHSLGLLPNGTLYSWGNAAFGATGRNTCTPNTTPNLVCCNYTYTQVSVATSHSFGIRTDGDLYSWGYNISGELGDGSATHRCVPTAVCGDLKWKAVSSGADHTMGITIDGDLYAWGCGNAGRLGNGSTLNRCVPTLVCCGFKWKAVAAGARHSLAITIDGDLYSWGQDLCGALGNCSGGVAKCVPTPVCCNFKWKAVSAGCDYTMAIRDDGTMYAWGNSLCGRLGNGTTSSTTYAPTPVCCNFKYKKVSTASQHVFAISEDGVLYGWGANLLGQLGDNTASSRCVPTLICGGFKWLEISAQSGYSQGLAINGNMYTWGCNNFAGRFGNGTTSNFACVPTLVCCNFIWGTAPQQYKKTIPVVPGNSYPITLLANSSNFGTVSLTCSNNVNAIMLEYEA